MVKLEDAVIARLSSIAVDKVFKDSKKGDAVSGELIRKTFCTFDVFRVAEEIIKRDEDIHRLIDSIYEGTGRIIVWLFLTIVSSTVWPSKVCSSR
ncbi:MAG: hypothetical protein ABH852_03550 [Methanobacteriota archaeon]